MHKIWMREYRVQDALGMNGIMNEPGFREHPDYESWAINNKDSLFSMTFGYGNTVIACAGGHRISDENVEVWLLLSDSAKDFKKEVAIYSKRVIDAWHSEGDFKRMQCTVDAGSDVAVRFAKFLGFNKEGWMPFYGPYGRDYYMMSRVK